jgi:hypothetical protein
MPHGYAMRHAMPHARYAMPHHWRQVHHDHHARHAKPQTTVDQ